MTFVLPCRRMVDGARGEAVMGVLRGEECPAGMQQPLQDRRGGHLREAVVPDLRRRQSSDHLRCPIGLHLVASPAAILVARFAHSRKATARTLKIASLFDRQALSLDDLDHGKDGERGRH